jgi:hypothetical protein
MSIESAILSRYEQQAKTNELDIDLLFDVISSYIKEYNWIYEGDACQQDIHALHEQCNLQVNCFILTDFFVHMSKKIGVSSDECFRVQIPNFVSNQDNPYIQGDYVPFSSALSLNEDGLYEFDVHCIAMVKGFCYDLVLQAKYPLLNDGANIYSSLSIIMGNDDLENFEYLLPELLNINEQCPTTGWTLMHDAIDSKKYDFASLLLKNGAQDNILDNDNITPLDILNMQIYDSSVSLETLRRAQEYLNLKMEICINNKMEQLRIENNAARSSPSFWRKGHTISDSSITPTSGSEQDYQITFAPLE